MKQAEELGYQRPIPFSAMVFVPVWVLYLLALLGGIGDHIDPTTNTLTAWSLGTDGDVVLEEYDEVDIETIYGKAAWLVRSRNGDVVSKYPPGAALLAAPVYALLRPGAQIYRVSYLVDEADGRVEYQAMLPYPPMWPAWVVGATSTALAILFLGLALRTLVDERTALRASWVAGLGTSMWSVSSQALWQHGPAMMWLGLGILLLTKQRPVAGGLSFAASVLTRPQAAFIVAAIGIGEAWSARSVKRLAIVGSTSALGAAAFVGFNLAIHGTPLPAETGVYYVDGLANSGMVQTLKNVALATFQWQRGFLIWSPFLLTLLPGLRAGWRVAPVWVKASAIGGVIYFVFQMRGNVWHGGLGHFSYRYPLEMLYAAAPLLTLAYREWTATKPWMRRPVLYTTVASIAAHATGALT